ncbi:R3H domain-containing protein 1-like isoform X2 [Trifolium pratense]|uniref:R3H domain-containing protein 1-like isoform X2 n=2 Tax=Trifolium pratense TaxID=57577 RepID=UPI001E6978EA|nr:R3H domain-containing protein 1-like isoform X2 [Trifolium pratense]
MEERLVNYLQAEDTSSDGILELEPMNSYNRHLLHRLAEIFGFAHESAGQGEYRHLILERCPDTSIPPILVSDILGMYDEPQSLSASHQILRRKEASPVSQTNTASIQQTQEERKAAYLLARERIFPMNLEEAKEPDQQKPRSVPVVTRQLIVHALGQRINTKNPNELVEELAFLVKDNLPCKHLVLTMEDFLVNYLQTEEDTSSDGILELEPMNSYNRLLLHRLAEIFGFAHESAGEGEDRHLILERCPDTSIPPILVSDILGTYDEPQSLIASHQILRRKEASPVSQTNTASIQQTLEERKTAYLLARERIFSMNLAEAKEPEEQKPRSVPVVARRMIAHALGQRINTKNPNELVSDSTKDRVLTDELNPQDNNSEKSYPTKDYEESSPLRRHSRTRNTGSSTSNAASLNKRNDQTPVNKDSPPLSRDGKQGETVSKEYMKKEHLGAAKRMFAHALGVHSGKDSSVPRSRNGENNKN